MIGLIGLIGLIGDATALLVMFDVMTVYFVIGVQRWENKIHFFASFLLNQYLKNNHIKPFTSTIT